MGYKCCRKGCNNIDTIVWGFDPDTHAVYSFCIDCGNDITQLNAIITSPNGIDFKQHHHLLSDISKLNKESDMSITDYFKIKHNHCTLLSNTSVPINMRHNLYELHGNKDITIVYRQRLKRVIYLMLKNQYLEANSYTNKIIIYRSYLSDNYDLVFSVSILIHNNRVDDRYTTIFESRLPLHQFK